MGKHESPADVGNAGHREAQAQMKTLGVTRT